VPVKVLESMAEMRARMAGLDRRGDQRAPELILGLLEEEG